MLSNQLRNLTLGELEFLAYVNQTGVLLKAGSRLGLSPSSSSRMLAKIQKKLGDACFVSLNGKYEPTEKFREIQPIVNQLLESAQGLNRQVFDPSSCSKTFRISSVMTEIAHVIGGVLPKMLKVAPKASIDLQKRENEFAAGFDGIVDFAVVTAVNLPPDAHCLNLYPLDRIVLLRKDHPLVKLRRPLRISDLQLYDRATIRSGRSNSWTGPEQDVFPYERFMSHTRFSTSRFYAAWEALEKTDLLAVCGWRAAEIAMRAYDLIAIPLPLDFKKENIWNTLIWSQATHYEDSNIWLRGIFSEWAKEEKGRIDDLIACHKGPPLDWDEFLSRPT